MIPYGRQTITEEDINAVISVLRGDFLTQGPNVALFERAICEFTGSKNAIAVTNGTAALHLAVLALGVEKGQKVICPPLSFAASANCALYCGGEVEFVDIRHDSMCLDPDLVEQRLQCAKPGEFAGIITVDFAGHASDLMKLSKIARKYGLWLLQDACHAVGGEYLSNGRSDKIGAANLSDAAVFSFHPVKHIATGEGGAITTNCQNLAKKISLLRTHGITRQAAEMTKTDGPWYYEMVDLGFNYRISDILCALGASQMSRLSGNIARRQEIANRYFAELQDLPIELPTVASGVKHAWHLYVIRVAERLGLYNHLRECGIAPQVHYLPIHQHPYYIARYGRQSHPVSDKVYQTCLSLPMFHGLTDHDQSAVIAAIKKFYA
jgi:UDP-4-amino-4,6-dideoxy-N-acetyl-beta-L-altrosamine transaminase